MFLNFLWIAVHSALMCGKELWGSKRSRILAIRKESFNETALFPLYCKTALC